MVVTPFHLVVGFGFSRFLFRDESVHAAVRALPVVTSILKEMRLAQSCTQKHEIGLKCIGTMTKKTTVAFVHIENTPSTGCRNGSDDSSWQVGADPSSSSSCSVPICIPEYWLSLPSSTLCRHREQSV